jgi:hypothetical protein
MMKQSCLKAMGVLVLLAGAALAGAQTSAVVKDDLFNGTEKFAKGASDVTEITMDPDTLKMVGGKNADKARRTVLNVVRTYSYDKPGMYNIADVEEFRNKLNVGEWHCSVHMRDTKRGESTDVCNRSRTDGLVETAIITVEPKELTFIHTIKQPGAGGPGGMSNAFTPFNPMVIDPEMRVQIAVQQAEMRAETAMIMPQTRVRSFTPYTYSKGLDGRLTIQLGASGSPVILPDVLKSMEKGAAKSDKLKDKDDKDKTKQPE